MEVLGVRIVLLMDIEEHHGTVWFFMEKNKLEICTESVYLFILFFFFNSLFLCFVLYRVGLARHHFMFTGSRANFGISIIITSLLENCRAKH